MRTSILVLLTLMISSLTSAQQDTGLEVLPGTKICVIVENISADAKAIGLTKELITTKVELQLRRNGVLVGTEDDAAESGMFLYVTCGVTDIAYALNIHFKRFVFYRVGDDLHSVTASTYQKGGRGTHAYDSQYVIQFLIDLIDMFSNDFLKANQDMNSSNKADVGDGR